MRATLIILMIWTSSIHISLSQPPQADVTTPKGNPVTAYITPEISNTLRAYYDASIATSSRTLLYYFGDAYSSSGRFNCHGYAWNMIEGGPVRWIGYYQYNTDEHIYWEDGSYIEVCSEMYPGKVSWASGDHSAITTSTPGRWVSKWGEGSLVEHNWNDTPYGTSNLKYYVSTSISGSTSLLCSGTRTLSVVDIPGATYTWSVSTHLLSIVSGQGTNQITVQRNGSSFGQGWVEVEISTPCSSGSEKSARFQFQVGGNEPQIYDVPSTVCAGGTYFAYGSPSFDGVYHWDVPGGTIISGQGTATIQFAVDNLVPPNTSSTVGITLTVTGECGTPVVKGISVPVIDCSGGGTTWMVYPNPASEVLTVAVGSEAERNSVTDKSTLSTFTALLYDSTGRQLRQGESKDGKVEFDTRQLPAGTYFLHIHHGDAVEKRQVVIRH